MIVLYNKLFASIRCNSNLLAPKDKVNSGITKRFYLLFPLTACTAALICSCLSDITHSYLTPRFLSSQYSTGMSLKCR